MQRPRCCPFIPREQWTPHAEGGLLSGHVAMGTPDKDLLREVTPDGEERLLYDHCPGAYARTTVAIEADRAWRWWSKSQLALLYPGGVPTAVIDAVEVCEATRFAWKAEGERLRKIETDKK